MEGNARRTFRSSPSALATEARAMSANALPDRCEVA